MEQAPSVKDLAKDGEQEVLSYESSQEELDSLADSALASQDQDEYVRPKRLDDFIGQPLLRANLRIFIDAAKKQRRSLDHTLFYGNPGLGKTTLARIIAHEMDAQLVTTSGPVLERSGDLAAILTKLEPNEILFVDEIHRMPIAVEEILYPAMEDFHLDIVCGQGPAARTVTVDLVPFTLVGATTRMGLISSPLRGRFGILQHLEFYSPEELAQIVLRTARICNVQITKPAALEIGRRSRGTPRIANRFLRRVADFALVEGSVEVTLDITVSALAAMGVDEMGLDLMDRKILKVLLLNYNGGPVGLKTLAAASSEDVRTIEEIYEPYLIHSGFLKRTPRGRMATEKAHEHLAKLISSN